MTDKPLYVTEMETIYGAPSQAGFGSAVFYETLAQEADLSQAAREMYRHFVGDAWARFGEDAWMGPWEEVYARQSGAERDVVAGLQSIQDRDAASSVSMILDNVDDPNAARAALAVAYDDPAVEELRVFTLGDGGAMSGLLIAGRRETGEAVFLVFLLD